MKKMCQYLRRCCVKHESVGNAVMLLATALFAGTLGLSSWYQKDILAWIKVDPILNPILIGGAVVFEVLLLYALTKMVFTDCRAEELEHNANAGRGSVLPRSTTWWVEKLGKNPKRQ